MSDQSLVLKALAKAAAEEEGHGPCDGFEVRGRLLACPCGVAYEVDVPVKGTEVAS